MVLTTKHYALFAVLFGVACILISFALGTPGGGDGVPSRAPTTTTTELDSTSVAVASVSSSPSSSSSTTTTTTRQRPTFTPYKPYPTRGDDARAVIVLFLTDPHYHGTKLFKLTLPRLIQHFLVPQRNIDLALYYDREKMTLQDVEGLLPPNSTRIPNHYNHNNKNDGDSDAVLYIVDPRLRDHPVYVRGIVQTFPSYIEANRSLLTRRDWRRCGCPPFCPLKQATVGYIQGTRWYTHDIFFEPHVLRYDFWIKLDVDIWFFRPVPYNVVGEMVKRGALFMHTGMVDNGHGCSDELQGAIEAYCEERNLRPVAEGQTWFTNDKWTFYTNFVATWVGFHASREHLELAKYLNEFPNGFFKHRWTDQSLFNKVFGVFFGPHLSNFTLDLKHLRFKRKGFHRRAVFWHGKSQYSRSQLAQHTKL
eukprot:PhM_4_TR13131/c0_g1_i1/m.17990